jgi:hypothetical protein
VTLDRAHRLCGHLSCVHLCGGWSRAGHNVLQLRAQVRAHALCCGVDEHCVCARDADDDEGMSVGLTPDDGMHAARGRLVAARDDVCACDQNHGIGLNSCYR